MPDYEETDYFMAYTATAPRDDRHITVRRQIVWHELWGFKWKTLGPKLYKDSTGADFECVGKDVYRHIRLGIDYTRDRTKYG